MKLTTEDTEDTERATPETDAKVSGHIGFYSCATVPAELCRRMERERDELREAWYQMQSSFERSRDEVERVIRERDEARDQVEELTAVIKGLRAIMRQEAAK